MRFGPQAQRILGVGDGTISLDGAAIGRGGAVSTFSFEECIYQNTAGTLSVNACRYDTRAVRVLDASVGAGELRGNVGVWMAFIATGPHRGVRTNTGYFASDERGLDVSSDWLLYTCVYQAGHDFTIRLADGTPLRSVQTGDFYGNSQGVTFRALSGQRAAWVEVDARTHAYQIAGFVAPTWNVYAVVPVELNDVVYLLEAGADRLTLRPADSLSGWVVTEGPAYVPDAVAANGKVVAGWSMTVGEGPQDGRSVPVDVSQPMVDLGAAVPPVEPPSGALTRVAVPAFPRKAWFSTYFERTQQYDSTQKERIVGNALLLVPDSGGSFSDLITSVLPLGYPLIVAAKVGEIPEAAWNTIVALYVHASSMADAGAQLPALRAAFGNRQKPWHCYIEQGDAVAYPALRPSWLAGDVVVTAQAYRRESETPDAFLGRLTAVNAVLQGYGQTFGNCYRFDTAVHSVDEIVTEDAPVYERLIREWSLLKNIEAFSGCREQGPTVAMNLSPALRESANRLYLAIPDRPSRYDGIVLPTMSEDETLAAKVKQNISLYDLSERDRARILALLPQS